MASKTGAWLASFASQLVSPASSIVSASIGPVSDRTAFPVAFVSAELVDVNLDIRTALDCRYEVTVLIQGKSSEQVWLAWDELLVLLVPYGSANAMYASGVNFLSPLRGNPPHGAAAGTNELIEGTLVFDVRCRYAY